MPRALELFERTLCEGKKHFEETAIQLSTICTAVFILFGFEICGTISSRFIAVS